jgi:kinesin family protein 12
MPASATQTDVFEESGVTTLLDKAMQGYACTIFAFGQTGSGKTHTMTGELTEENMGIVPRGLRYIWDKVQPTLQDQNEDTKYQIKASYLEVYNETVSLSMRYR